MSMSATLCPNEEELCGSSVERMNAALLVAAAVTKTEPEGTESSAKAGLVGEVSS